MADVNTFTSTAKWLHWIMALLIVLVLIFGLGLENYSQEERLTPLMGHTGIGLTVLVLALLRVFWRRGHPAPALPGSMSPRQQKLAKLNTRLLYGLMIYQPVIGLLHGATYAGGDVRPFGLFNLTALLPSSAGVTKVFHVLHALGAFAFILVITLHVLAALKHWLIDRDKVFQRMLPYGKGE